MNKIAILIPCLNEESTISQVVYDFRQEIPEAVIYIYDNNSTDCTAKNAQNAGAVVKNVPQRGKGNVLRRMFHEIEAECYVIVDGDNTYSAKDVHKLVEPILSGEADMVIGDRLSKDYYEKNTRPGHGFGNSLVNKTINKLFKSDIKDVMTGYRSLSFEFVKTFPARTDGFEIETEMTIFGVYHNIPIKSVIVDYKERQTGSVSKLHTIRDGFKVLNEIRFLHMTYKPFAFFSILACMLSALSVGFFIPILSEYISTGLVPRFPTLIVCGMVLLFAAVLFVTGVILQTLKRKEYDDFAYRYNTLKIIKDRIIS